MKSITFGRDVINTSHANKEVPLSTIRAHSLPTFISNFNLKLNENGVFIDTSEMVTNVVSNRIIQVMYKEDFEFDTLFVINTEEEITTDNLSSIKEDMLDIISEGLVGNFMTPNDYLMNPNNYDLLYVIGDFLIYKDPAIEDNTYKEIYRLAIPMSIQYINKSTKLN